MSLSLPSSAAIRSDRSHSASTHPLQRLLGYGQSYHTLIWQAVTCSILNKLFDLAPPVLIGVAVDIVVQKQDSFLARWGAPDITTQLVILTILTVLVWGGESLFQYAYSRLWRNLAQTIQHDLRLDAYCHIQNLDMAYFEDQSTGNLLSILNDDINQLERFLDNGANSIIHIVTTVLVITIAFFLTAPQVAWMAMLPMPLIVWGSLVYQKRLAPRYREVRDRVSQLNSRLSNNLNGITTIKSFATEYYEAERVREESAAYRLSNRRAIALSSAFVPVIRIVILAGFAVTLLMGGIDAAAGRMSVGTYSVLVFMTQSLLWPLTGLGEIFDQYQRAMASTSRVLNLLDTRIAIHPGKTVLEVGAVQGEINLQQVTFAYRDRAPILRNLSLHIPAGKTTAIVGSTGSGKSTLVKLLLRLYEVDTGRITLDGLELKELRLRDLRRAIGLVSQDVFLFHGTVRENIAYGTFDATDAEIIQAAKAAEAHEFIMQLPWGYDTIVGERGQKLSGGQRQRLAIARAIVKDPPILILDEATSAVDNETEAAIQRSLERITQNRTTIAIAHRLSTIRNADRIYVMDQGHLVEQGQHEELLALDGIYANLWRIQMGIKT